MFSINLNIAIVLIIFFFVLYPLLILFIFRKKTVVLQVVSKISIVLYFVLLCVLVFGNVSTKNNIFTVSLVVDASFFSLDFCVASFNKTNILYNLIMMFPISAYFFANSKNLLSTKQEFLKVQKQIFLKSALLSFGISFFIELFQFVLPVSRTTEVLDLVLNTFSGVLGYVFFFCVILIYKIVLAKKQRKEIK